LAGEPFKPSENDYDWLGHGIYFWEANPKRAASFAIDAMARKGLASKPAVIGAVIEPGLCLDLMSEAGLEELAIAYSVLSRILSETGDSLPQNRPDGRRNLDCAIIETLHGLRKVELASPFDTVRGMFAEGGALFPGSGFQAKTHIQICVRDPAHIKGVFRVKGI
jgi:hypothetical protein